MMQNHGHMCLKRIPDLHSAPSVPIFSFKSCFGQRVIYHTICVSVQVDTLHLSHHRKRRTAKRVTQRVCSENVLYLINHSFLTSRCQFREHLFCVRMQTLIAKQVAENRSVCTALIKPRQQTSCIMMSCSLCTSAKT